MSIQIDNGDFTRIHNDILDGLAKARFSALEFRCLFFLVRMTYGWQKKEDVISLAQWAEGLGMDSKNKGNILNTLDSLVAKGAIHKRANGTNRPLTWSINKDFFEKQTVIPEHNSPVDESESTVISGDNRTVISEHNSLDKEIEQTVISEHNRTVMQPHNSFKKEEKEKVIQKEKEEKRLKKVKETPRAPARSGDVHPNTQAIMDAYIEALGYKPGSYGKESSAAKRLAKDGFAPSDIVAAYNLLKQEQFWRAKHLSLQTIAEQIPALQQALLKGVPLSRAPTNGAGYMSKGEKQEAEVDKALQLLEQRRHLHQ